MGPNPSTPSGRTLAIGDIHGCSRALDGLLGLVQPRPQDLVIALGDYVDRGPDSAGVLDRLLQLRDRCRLVALKGNHEEMMLKARDGLEVRGWLLCGGRETLASYGPEGGAIDELDIPEAHWDFMENVCIDWYETDSHFFVHANVYPDMVLEDQPGFMLRWETLLAGTRPHCSGKVMVCGHTAQRSGVPLNLGHIVCIDTWVYGQGWLTCLEVATGRIWQASERCDTRTGWLEEPEDYPDDDL